MKSILFTLISIAFLYSCNQEKKGKIGKFNSSNFQDTNSFLKLFPTIDPANLHIYTPAEYETKPEKYTGTVIPSQFYKFLKFKNYLELVSIDTFYHFYSLFKFKMSGNRTGLLVRRPSQYSETAIDLFTWDNSKQKIIDAFNLTDAFGDEGWHFIQDAWLTDLNKDGLTDIITRRKDYDQDLEDSTKISSSDSLFVLLNNGISFQKSNFRIDTSKYQLQHWQE